MVRFRGLLKKKKEENVVVVIVVGIEVITTSVASPAIGARPVRLVYRKRKVKRERAKQ